MRAVHENQLIGPARYILSLLRDTSAIRYSEHIYDGSMARHERLLKEIQLDDPNDGHSIESLIDEALDQLEEQGLLLVKELNTKLVDGDNDFLIELTFDGREVLTNKRSFELQTRFYEEDRLEGYRTLTSGSDNASASGGC